MTTIVKLEDKIDPVERVLKAMASTNRLHCVHQRVRPRFNANCAGSAGSTCLVLRRFDALRALSSSLRRFLLRFPDRMSFSTIHSCVS